MVNRVRSVSTHRRPVRRLTASEGSDQDASPMWEGGEYLEEEIKDSSLGLKQFSSLDVRQVLGYIGSLFLMLGVFSPLVSLPVIGGSTTYIGRGTGDGVFVLLVGVLGLVLSATRKYKLIIWVAFLALLIMAITFITFQSKINDLLKNSTSELETSLGSVVQLQWGWGILLMGAMMLGTASLIKEAE